MRALSQSTAETWREVLVSVYRAEQEAARIAEQELKDVSSQLTIENSELHANPQTDLFRELLFDSFPERFFPDDLRRDYQAKIQNIIQNRQPHPFTSPKEHYQRIAPEIWEVYREAITSTRARIHENIQAVLTVTQIIDKVYLQSYWQLTQEKLQISLNQIPLRFTEGSQIKLRQFLSNFGTTI